MKRFVLGVFAAICLTFGGLALPSFISSNSIFSAAEEQWRDVTNLAELQAMSLNNNYVLKDDIHITNAFTPIGQKSSEFTGKFDGNGKKIFIDNASGFKGLFGSILGAEIKNLKIQFLSSDEVTLTDSAYGTIASKAENSLINGCEIEGSAAFKVSSSTIFGGVVGVLDNSRLVNTASYLNINIDKDTTSSTLNFGGLVGQIKNSSELYNTCIFNNFSLNVSAENVNRVGGIAGEISGANSCIKNAMVGVNTLLTGQGTNVYGKLIGAVTASSGVIPNLHNLLSIAYTGKESLIGQANGYTIFPQDDNILEVELKTLGSKNTIFDDNGDTVTEFNYTLGGVNGHFSWCSFPSKDSAPWPKDLWLVNQSTSTDYGGEPRLEQFQSFSVSLYSNLDMLNLLEKVTSQATGGYGEVAQLKVKFKDSTDKDYYTVRSVYRGNLTVSDAKYLDDSPTGSQSDDVVYYWDNDELVLSIILSSKTEGQYRFEVVENNFEGKLKIFDSDSVTSAVVRFTSIGQSQKDFVKNRDTSQVSDTAYATAGSKYRFEYWTLYYLDEKQDYTEDVKLPDGVIFYDGSYYKSVSKIYTSYTDENTYTYARANLPINFGISNTSLVLINGVQEKNYLNQPFLLEAKFEEDPYTLKFTKNANGSHILNISINNEDLDNNGEIKVGKSGSLTIKISVESGYVLDSEAFIKSISMLCRQDTNIRTKEEVLDGKTDYSFTFNSNMLNTEILSSTVKTFNFSVNLISQKQANQNKNLGLIIGLSVGGGVLLLGIVALLVYLFYFRGIGGGGGGNKTKEKKPTGDDYKKYYY